MDVLQSDLSQPPRLLRVVVVDDEPDHVMAVLAALRAAGFEANGYGSGKAALAGIRDFAPDVVVSDLSMPGLNGWDLAREVRRNAPQSRHPLMIAVTRGQATSADEAMMRSVGFNDFLAKPVDPNALLDLIRKRF